MICLARARFICVTRGARTESPSNGDSWGEGVFVDADGVSEGERVGEAVIAEGFAGPRLTVTLIWLCLGMRMPGGGVCLRILPAGWLRSCSWPASFMRKPVSWIMARACVKGSPTTGGTGRFASVAAEGVCAKPGIRGNTNICINTVVPAETTNAVRKATKKLLSWLRAMLMLLIACPIGDIVREYSKGMDRIAQAILWQVSASESGGDRPLPFVGSLPRIAALRKHRSKKSEAHLSFGRP